MSLSFLISTPQVSVLAAERRWTRYPDQSTGEGAPKLVAVRGGFAAEGVRGRCLPARVGMAPAWARTVHAVQDELLAAAEAGRWSRSALREAVKAYKRGSSAATSAWCENVSLSRRRDISTSEEA